MDLIIFLLLVSVYVYSLVYVYRDARRRNKGGVAAVLFVSLLLWPVSLVLWRIISRR